MKDAYGRELALGDEFVYAQHQYNGKVRMVRGRVVKTITDNWLGGRSSVRQTVCEIQGRDGSARIFQPRKSDRLVIVSSLS